MAKRSVPEEVRISPSPPSPPKKKLRMNGLFESLQKLISQNEKRETDLQEEVKLKKIMDDEESFKREYSIDPRPLHYVKTEDKVAELQAQIFPQRV